MNKKGRRTGHVKRALDGLPGQYVHILSLSRAVENPCYIDELTEGHEQELHRMVGNE